MQRLTTTTTIHAGHLQHEHMRAAAQHRLAATAAPRRRSAGLSAPVLQIAVALVLSLVIAVAIADSADASVPTANELGASPVALGQPELPAEERRR